MTGLRPFFSYYGGKWRDAKSYPSPKFATVVEPFAGSAGYALRYPERRVILGDVDPIIVGVWQYLIAAKESEILSICDIGDDETVDDLDACQEARWLVGFWLNKGSAGPRKRPSSWMRSGISPGSFWGDRVRSTIASQLSAIRHWTIQHRSYDDIAAPGSNATWFVDPPYQAAGKHYRFGSKHVDFPMLSEKCAALASGGCQVIACENEGASWLPFRPLAEVKTSRPGRRSSEYVWISDEERAA